MWIAVFAVLGFAVAVLIVARDRRWGRVIGLGGLGASALFFVVVLAASGSGGSPNNNATPSYVSTRSPTPTLTAGTFIDTVELQAPTSVEAGQEFELTLDIRGSGAPALSDISRAVVDADPQVISADLVAPGLHVVSAPPASQGRPAEFTWVLRGDRAGSAPLRVKIYDATSERALSFLGDVSETVAVATPRPTVAAPGATTSASTSSSDSAPDKILGVTADVFQPLISLFVTAGVTAVTTAYVKTIFDRRAVTATTKRGRRRS